MAHSRLAAAQDRGRSPIRSLPIAMLFVAGLAQAQTDSEKPEEIIVSGSRTGTAVADLPVSFSVVDTEELISQLEFSTNVMRALELVVPGLAPQREGRSNCSPNIRGRATSVQINGIPVNEELRESTCNQMYQLSPFAIQRVEVLRGGTALYGAGSPGGIINFVTRRARSEQLEIDAVAQTSFHAAEPDETFTTDLYAGAGQNFGNWDYYGGIAWTDGGVGRNPDDGFTPGREYETIALNGSLGAKIGGGEARFTGTWYEEEPGVEYWVPFPDFQTDADGHPIAVPVEPHPFIDEAVLRSWTTALSYAHPEVWGYSLEVSVYHQDQFYAQRDNLFGCCLTATDSDHSRTGFRSTLVKRLQVGDADFIGRYGLDVTRNRYFRPEFGPDARTVIAFVSPEVLLNTYAVFAQGELDFGRLRITGGVRQEWYRGEIGTDGLIGNEDVDGAATPGDFGDSDLALFNVGAVFDLNDALQLYGGFSQGAELSELGRASRNITDPGLITPEPATSEQYELGVRGQTDDLDYELAGFYSTSDKAALLQIDPACTDDLGCFLVPLRVAQRFWGLEGSLGWRATEQLELSGVVTLQRGKVFDEEFGRYVRYSTDVVAPFRATGIADYRLGDRWEFSLQGTWYAGSDYLTPGGPVETDSVFLADASVHYRIGEGELYLAAANLLDEQYINVSQQAIGNVPGGYFYTLAERRRVTVGYRARF